MDSHVNIATGRGPSINAAISEYLLPNPSQEPERLDLQHLIFQTALDGALGMAPVDSPKRILDIGTGTGIWAVEYAKANPNATVIGTELTAPAQSSPLSNCTLTVADAEDESWPFSHSFDYIHLRMTISCFKSRRKVLANCLANLALGGWIELQDIHFAALSDDGSSSGTALELWCREMVKGAAAIGRNLHDASQYAQILAGLGCVEVAEKRLTLPWGPWSNDPKLKELGRLQAFNSRQGGRGTSAKILAAADHKPSEVEDLLKRVKLDLENTDVHAYAPIYVVYGRKPL